MPKVSVIIPCLNSVKYIRETMESVVNQTLRDIEILVVDAGSTDGTLDVLHEYADSDERVRIIHSDRKSTGYQCNVGMDASSGEYIGFVETDDYIALTMYEELYAIIMEEKVDYVKSDFEMFADTSVGRVFVRYRPLCPENRGLYNKIISIVDCPELILRDVNIWNGLYAKNFIERKRIKQNETPGAAFQDIGFVLQTLIHAEKVIYIDRSHYRYRRDNTGSSVYNKNTCDFITWELEYVMRCLADASFEPFRLCCPMIYARLFEMFSYNLGIIYLGSGETSRKIQNRILRFKGIFQEAYDSMDDAARIWVNPVSYIKIKLLLDDSSQFYQRLRQQTEYDQKLLCDFIRYLNQQSTILIFGAGEIGGAVFCYLLRCGIDVVGFCDNNTSRWGESYMGRMIFSPTDAARQYPEGAFVISLADDYILGIKSQLMKFGIKPEKICRYVNLIAPHTAFEIDAMTDVQGVEHG